MTEEASGAAAATPWPRYSGDNMVEARKVASVTPHMAGTDIAHDEVVLHFYDNPSEAIAMPLAWWCRVNPDNDQGGYVVRYADGYMSWSPALAFEQGYTLIEE